MGQGQRGPLALYARSGATCSYPAMTITDRMAEEAAYRGLLAILPPAAASEVDGAMREPHRRYHAPWHLGRMWRLHRELKGDAWASELGWAIAYHDVVYDPRSRPRQNEYASAARFLTAAHAAGLGIEPSARIAGWILASADHLGAGSFVSPEADPAGAWFLDLDLEPLASEGFQANTALIREEFRHVADKAFANGRAEFLRRILREPAIYRTEKARRLGWEAAARRNMTADLGG